MVRPVFRLLSGKCWTFLFVCLFFIHRILFFLNCQLKAEILSGTWEIGDHFCRSSAHLSSFPKTPVAESNYQRGQEVTAPGSVGHAGGPSSMQLYIFYQHYTDGQNCQEWLWLASPPTFQPVDYWQLTRFPRLTKNWPVNNQSILATYLLWKYCC
jgi:hypothetical protein